MPTDDDIIFGIAFDVKNEQGAKAADERIRDIDKAATKETQTISKNNAVWERHLYTVRANVKEYEKLRKLFISKSLGGSFQLAGADNSAYSKKLNEINAKIDDAHHRSLKSSKGNANQKAIAKEEQKFFEQQRDEFMSAYFDEFFNKSVTNTKSIKTKEAKAAEAIAKKKAADDSKKKEAMAKRYLEIRTNSRKLEEKMGHSAISRHDAYQNVLTSQQKGQAIPQGALNVLTSGLPPEVSQSYHNAWRESSKLFGQTDKMKRWADGMHTVSEACLDANMSALGLFFSMLSVINLMRQGITGLFGPLGDVGAMFESLAMSEAFGMGVEYDANKMVDAWMKFTGLKSDLSATMAVIGAEVLTDPQVWESISSGVKAFMTELRKPETIQAIKDLVIALANALPKIAKEIPGIANFITKSAPLITELLPWAIKAAIAMPFLSIATGIASMTAALMRGIAALARFRALRKSVGLVGALGGLAGVPASGGIASGLPVPVPGGGGEKKPKTPKTPKPQTSKNGKFVNDILEIGIVSVIVDKFKGLLEPLKLFKDKIINIVKPFATPRNLLRIGGGFLGALSLVQPVGGGSEMTIGPNGEYIMGGQNITPSRMTSTLTTDNPVVEQQTININLYGNVTNENLDTIINTIQNAKNYGSGI